MKRNWKIVFFWILGSFCIFLGSMIVGQLEMGPGVSDLGYALAMLIAFVLFLLGGLLWVSVSVAAKKMVEE